ncbi:hypothetical protein V2J09_006926 [Rumex salicifolius]
MEKAAIFGGLVALVALYCSLDPFHHSPIHGFPDFVSTKVEMSPWSQIPFPEDPQNRLQKSEIIFMNQVQGPESVAFDPMGRGPYTGVADGRVLFWNGLQWTDFAYTSSNRSNCNPKPNMMDYWKDEHICGRPLGLRFHKTTGELYIADAYFGLMKVGPEGGLATSLTTEAEGVPFGFTNDLDIDDQGNVYFTDSSTKYQRRNFMQLIFSAENSGRVLKYDPVANETTVLVRNIQFPNGISLSKDGLSLIYAEHCPGRLQRLWLKGGKAGRTEVFAILPGFPDNIRFNDKGELWVAIPCRKNLYSHILGIYPRLRSLMLSLPLKTKYHTMFVGGGLNAGVAKYSSEGKLMEFLEDRQGKVVRAASEVEEKDGKLWFGSVLMPFMATYDLTST